MLGISSSMIWGRGNFGANKLFRCYGRCFTHALGTLWSLFTIWLLWFPIKVVSIHSSFWCLSMSSCPKSLCFPLAPYKASNYYSAYTGALLIRLTKISSAVKKICNIEDGLKCSFMSNVPAGRVLVNYNWFKKLRTEENLSHSKKYFCVNVWSCLESTVGVVKLKEIQYGRDVKRNYF